MDKSTGILLGVAGAGALAALGYSIYSKKKDSSNIPGTTPNNYQSHKDQQINSSQRRSTKKLGFDWKRAYTPQYIQHVEKVLYNAIDSLSTYGCVNPDLFLDIVHYLDQYCLVYLHSLQDPKNLEWIVKSSKLQTILTNAISELQKAVETGYPIEQRYNILKEFQQRAGLVTSIIESYNANIIRQSNSI